MWKSNVMKNIILSLLFVILICARCVSFAQQYDYRNLFSNLLVEAPDTLSIEYLKELPKFRCVHHDGFDRLDTIPVDPRTKQKNEKYTLADEKHIGKNSLQNEAFFAYSELSTRNATFDVGVFGDSAAFNSLNGDKHQRKIEYIDVGRKNYGFMAKRGGMVGCDAKVAFRIKDINNFYYVRLTEKDLSLYKMERGKKKCLWNKKINDYHTLYALMDADTLHFYADYQYQGKKLVDKYGGNDLCGLLFTGNEKSLVDDFELYLITIINNKQWDEAIYYDNLSLLEYVKSQDWIHYYSKLKNSEVMDIIKQCHVGLLPTWFDTYGYSVLEMQACGVPVISTNVRAMSEINKYGWIIEMPINFNKEIKPVEYKYRELLIGELYNIFMSILSNKKVIQEKSISCLNYIRCHHSPEEYSKHLKQIYSEFCK